jgi:hypothetical protein
VVRALLATDPNGVHLRYTRHIPYALSLITGGMLEEKSKLLAAVERERCIFQQAC